MAPAERGAAIERLDVSAFTIPTDEPESDGTFDWQATTIVVVQAKAGGVAGLGYTYADAAAAAVVRRMLAPVVVGRDAMAIESCYAEMIRAVRNIGRQGLAANAISAVDIALWDLKARRLGVPLVTLLGAVRRSVPIYGSGGFISYSIGRLQEQFGGWAADGIGAVKMKIGRDTAVDRERVRAAREAIGSGVELFVDAARRWLEQTLDTMAPEIDAGVPIVGLEPSCVAVFRDEMRELLPAREDAKRLSRQTFLLSEYLNRERFAYPQLQRKAVVHGHCHHKAVMKIDGEEEALRAMGLDVELLDSGCCGMAGSFGFEAAHYDVSMKVGEQVLLPAVRSAPRDTIIVADGFSCRTQIAQATDRRALHLAELIELAAGGGPTLPNEEFPERRAVPSYLATPRQHRRRQWLGVGMTIAALAAAALLRRRRSVSRLDALRSMDGGA
jgi:hypothetical protein